jgi:hypothetical protein
MRPVRIIDALLFAATVAMLAPLAAPAWAAPVPTLGVSPGSVTAGGDVVVSGSVGSQPAGSACATGVLLLSRAFDHARDFAGVPAVVAAIRPDGTFAVTTRIPRSRAAGAYDITGRCGGGNLGVSATLVGLAAGTLAALGVWGCCTGAAIGRPGPVGTLRAGSGNPGPAMT